MEQEDESARTEEPQHKDQIRSYPPNPLPTPLGITDREGVPTSSIQQQRITAQLVLQPGPPHSSRQCSGAAPLGCKTSKPLAELDTNNGSLEGLAWVLHWPEVLECVSALGGFASPEGFSTTSCLLPKVSAQIKKETQVFQTDAPYQALMQQVHLTQDSCTQAETVQAGE